MGRRDVGVRERRHRRRHCQRRACGDRQRCLDGVRQSCRHDAPGIASPVRLAADRGPALPVDRQRRFAAGVQYDVNANYTIGFAYEYANLGSADLNVTRPTGTLQGDYRANSLNVFNLTVLRRFRNAPRSLSGTPVVPLPRMRRSSTCPAELTSSL
jgi:hypothetical protein